jgi:hypothetical protein
LSIIDLDKASTRSTARDPSSNVNTTQCRNEKEKLKSNRLKVDYFSL